MNIILTYLVPSDLEAARARSQSRHERDYRYIQKLRREVVRRSLETVRQFLAGVVRHHASLIAAIPSIKRRVRRVVQLVNRAVSARGPPLNT